MSMLCSARLRGDFSFAPEDILAFDRAAIGVNAAVNNPAAADHPVIHQNKATKWWKPIVVIEYNRLPPLGRDRKSTRLNSSHVSISYAVFCLKKKKKNKIKTKNNNKI